ncbi:SapC family protein [Ruegeria lacuscaerulensis]|uniref:SapC family protein n=1 Tax=Ruegeria lacuscaerulensis TaxID=55218 RepID=UPI0014801B06|nr:SapC family protein [Ruegeria lacuscaerulensis]
MAQNGQFPLTFSRYQGKYWKRFTSFRFAQNLTECPIVEKEIRQVAAAFPIVFRRAGTEIHPFALLSLSGARTPFVSDDGRWLAGYVPSDLRCPPFRWRASQDPAKQDLNAEGLLVDESLGFVGQEGEPFFNASGDLTPELRQVFGFLKMRAQNKQKTAAICNKLDTFDLLQSAGMHEGIEFPEGILIVDSGKLAALTDKDKLALINDGTLRLVHAHQVSLSHCAWLASAERNLTTCQVQTSYTENSDLSGFLGAMALAQWNEIQQNGSY